MKFSCAICGDDNYKESFQVREMMWGFRDVFTYLECSKCGCLQIESFPSNIQKYYPSEYYSLGQSLSSQNNQKKIVQFLKRKKANYWLGNFDIIGWLLATHFTMPGMYNWLKPCGVKLKSKLLDVGSGNGILLNEMNKEGFYYLTGIDPFLPKTIIYSEGYRLIKGELSDLNEHFDIILLNHSLEHLSDQHGTFNRLGRLLNPKGFLIVRIPIKDTYAWRNYKTNWSQLDAPRHFYLHTLKSMELLAKAHGFSISKIIYDAWAFQLWGSEQYKKDIDLMDKRSYSKNPQLSIFSKDDILKFEQQTKELNENQDGDQVSILLTRSSEE
jgi:SAM-dependent methyltransferase